MLWFHPILVTRRNAHGGLLEAADEAGSTDFDHFWVWVRVEAGTELEVAALSGGRATP